MTPRAVLRGSLLRERRRDLGETQEQFAAACGIPRDQYAKAEAGTRSLPLAAAILVARRLGLHVEDLYDLVTRRTAPAAGPCDGPLPAAVG